MDVIRITFPVSIGGHKYPKPPCTAEAWPEDGNPNLRANGLTPIGALKELLPKIISERDLYEKDGLRWEKLDLSRAKAEHMLANPADFSLW
jgi:hypothetical protein